MKLRMLSRRVIAAGAALGLAGAVIASVVSALTPENFDGVVAPALPAGWTASSLVVNAASTPWATTAAGAIDSAPNAAVTNDPSTVSDEVLISPSMAVFTAADTLNFRNNYDMESGFDGGVLEISLNGGASWADIQTQGTFLTGGYNGTISVNFSNPIGGRQAWTSTSAGYITTTVRLNAALAGQNVMFRWRRATDSSVADTGWRIDTITTGVSFPTDCSTFGATVTIDGTANSDTIFVPQNSPARVRVNALAGNDTVQVTGSAAVCVEGGDGNDTITGGAGHDVLIGGNGIDTIAGGNGNDLLVGGDGHDTLNGGAGNDGLQGGAGFDTLVGGMGTDTGDGGADHDSCSGVESTTSCP